MDSAIFRTEGSNKLVRLIGIILSFEIITDLSGLIFMLTSNLLKAAVKYGLGYSAESWDANLGHDPSAAGHPKVR